MTDGETSRDVGGGVSEASCSEPFCQQNQSELFQKTHKMSFSSNDQSCDVIQDLLAIFNTYETRPDSGEDEFVNKFCNNK